MTLSMIIDTLFPGRAAGWSVRDDSNGQGPYIDLWDEQIMGQARPAAVQLDEWGTHAGIIARQKNFSLAVQQRLDNFALTRDYDNIAFAATYAVSAVSRFALEGQYAIEIRDATWALAMELMPQVTSGQLAIEDALAQLPALEWPEGVSHDL